VSLLEDAVDELVGRYALGRRALEQIGNFIRDEHAHPAIARHDGDS
jgi:hypothetical protein